MELFIRRTKKETENMIQKLFETYEAKIIGVSDKGVRIETPYSSALIKKIDALERGICERS